jgi:hypothetical protein
MGTRTNDDASLSPEDQAAYEKHLAEVTDGRGDESPVDLDASENLDGGVVSA